MLINIGFIEWRPLVDSFLKYIDFFALSKSEISPYILGMFFTFCVVFIAVIFENIGKKNNHKLFGKILQRVGIFLIFITGLYITWYAIYLATISIDMWPIELTEGAFVFLEICYGLIILSFATLCLYIFILWLVIFFGKKVKEQIKRRIYKKAYVLIKVIIVVGAIAWIFVGTHSSIYYNGINASFMTPLAIMSVFVLAILLILPSKIESGKDRHTEKRVKNISKTVKPKPKTKKAKMKSKVVNSKAKKTKAAAKKK